MATLTSESVKKLSLDMQQLSYNLQTILQQLEMFKSSQEASIQFFDVSYNEKLQEIREMRNILNAILDELEKTTLQELNDIRTTLQTSLKKDIDNCRTLKDELQRLGEAVKSMGEKSKEDIEFIASWKCMEKIKESEAYLKENRVKGLCSMKFQADIDIGQNLSTKSDLGKIIVMNPNQVLTVKRKSKYNVNISSDTNKTCSIKGICSLSNDHVIVVDDDNKKVKLFDQQYKLVSQCEMSGGLWDICQISSSEVAVTVDRYVQFISVRNRQLITGRKFQLSHDAVGIAYHHGTLYVTSGYALNQYLLAGTRLKAIYEDKEVFMCAVSPIGDRIYVTKFNQHKSLTLAMDGTLISTFTDTQLQLPCGVHVTPAGHVLVCGNKSKTVIQVDREGKKKLATLLSQTFGEGYPMSVCVNKNIDQILVGQEDSNTLIVLEFQ